MAGTEEAGCDGGRQLDCVGGEGVDCGGEIAEETCASACEEDLPAEEWEEGVEDGYIEGGAGELEPACEGADVPVMGEQALGGGGVADWNAFGSAGGAGGVHNVGGGSGVDVGWERKGSGVGGSGVGDYGRGTVGPIEDSTEVVVGDDAVGGDVGDDELQALGRCVELQRNERSASFQDAEERDVESRTLREQHWHHGPGYRL